MERLAEPQTRQDLLLRLQDGIVSAHELPGVRLLRLRLETLRARPDVVAAIAAVGRVRRWPAAEDPI